jgi:hypothetical protein
MVKGKEHKDDHTPIRVAPPKSEPVAVVEPMPATGCVVCGVYGNLTGSAGHAQWHAACETARPDLIAKVKARA